MKLRVCSPSLSLSMSVCVCARVRTAQGYVSQPCSGFWVALAAFRLQFTATADPGSPRGCRTSASVTAGAPTSWVYSTTPVKGP